MTSLTYGNGETLSHEYDKAYRLVSLQDGPVSRTLTYDGAGNIVAIDEADSTGQSFGYDAVDRLTDASGSYGSRGYEYEEVGNRTLLDEDGNLTSYQYAQDSNRLTQSGSRVYQYDPAGNMTSDGERTFEYNQHGRLAAVHEGGVEIASYEYNALGQRVWKETAEGVVRFVYNQDGQLIGEYDEAGEPIREYVYFQGRPLVMVSDGQVYFYHVDHLGTPQELSDESGVTRWHAEYDPFGRANVVVGDVAQPIRFPGQYEDKAISLNYNGYRYYDYDNGRYLRADPVRFLGGLNLFVYGNSNPLRFTDPSGLSPIDCLIDYWLVGESGGGCMRREVVEAPVEQGVEFVVEEIGCETSCTAECAVDFAAGEAVSQATLSSAGWAARRFGNALVKKLAKRSIPVIGQWSTAYSGGVAVVCTVNCWRN